MTINRGMQNKDLKGPSYVLAYKKQNKQQKSKKKCIANIFIDSVYLVLFEPENKFWRWAPSADINIVAHHLHLLALLNHTFINLPAFIELAATLMNSILHIVFQVLVSYPMYFLPFFMLDLKLSFFLYFHTSTMSCFALLLLFIRCAH